MSGLFFGLFLICLHSLAVGEQFIALDRMEVECLLLFLALAGLLLSLLEKKTTPQEPPPVFMGSFWLSLFFAWGALGVFFSVRPEASFPFVTKYITGITLLLFVHRFLRDLDQVRMLFRILALVAVLGGIASWLLQAAFPQAPGITRNFLFLNSNFRGTYLLFPLAGLAALYLTQAANWRKGLTWSLFVLCWAQFGFIGSRGSYAAAGVVLSVLLWGLFRRNEKREAAGLLLGCVAGWVVFKLVFLLLSSGGSDATLENSLARSPLASSLYNRELFWDAALRIFLDHPLTGSGSWTFSLLFPHQGLPPFMLENTPPRLASAPHVHNLYLQILAETGVIGLGLFLVALFYFFKRLRPVYKSGDFISFHYGLCLIAGMAGFLAHNLIETMWPAPYFIFTVAIWYGIAAVVAPLSAQPESSPLPVRIWKRLPVPVLLAGAVVLWITFSYTEKMVAIKSGNYSTEEQMRLSKEAAGLCPACDFPYLHQAFIFTRKYEATRDPEFKERVEQALKNARSKTRYIPEALFIEGLLFELDGDYAKAMGRYLQYYRVGKQPERVFESLYRIRQRKRLQNARTPPSGLNRVE